MTIRSNLTRRFDHSVKTGPGNQRARTAGDGGRRDGGSGGGGGGGIAPCWCRVADGGVFGGWDGDVAIGLAAAAAVVLAMIIMTTIVIIMTMTMAPKRPPSAAGAREPCYIGKNLPLSLSNHYNDCNG